MSEETKWYQDKRFGPFTEREKGLIRDIEALAADRAALLGACKTLLGAPYDCDCCDATGKDKNDPDSICVHCGGTGFQLNGEAWQAVFEARAAIAAAERDE